jgi:hypothetical protein
MTTVVHDSVEARLKERAAVDRDPARADRAQGHRWSCGN